MECWKEEAGLRGRGMHDVISGDAGNYKHTTIPNYSPCCFAIGVLLIESTILWIYYYNYIIAGYELAGYSSIERHTKQATGRSRNPDPEFGQDILHAITARNIQSMDG